MSKRSGRLLVNLNWMMMLNKLRERTRKLHEELEGKNLASKIIDHSISREEYELLLFQNLLAYSKAEDSISNYFPEDSHAKSAKIKADLQNIGVENPDYNWDYAFHCKNEIEAVGVAYVMEGSALGGMMIAKEIKKCEALKSLPEQHFFATSKDSANGWNRFLKFLRSREFTEEEAEIASRKAVETFQLFDTAFKTEFSNS